MKPTHTPNLTPQSHVVFVCIALQQCVGGLLANRKIICLENVDAPHTHGMEMLSLVSCSKRGTINASFLWRQERLQRL